MSIPLHIKLIFSLFTHILIGGMSTQDTYKPLATIKNHDNGHYTLAKPDPRNQQQFEIHDKEKLICFCPPIDQAEPLIRTISKKKNCEKDCAKKVIPSLKYLETEKCAENAYWICSGYDMDTGTLLMNMSKVVFRLFRNEELPLIHILSVVNFCRNDNDEVLYVLYKLRAPSYLNQEMNEAPSQSKQYLNYGHERSDIFTFYEKENQKKSFQRLFGDDHEHYINWPDNENETQSTVRYFYMQQLAGSEDMVLDTWKRATYFFMNTAPMWISVSEGSWKKANHLVRLLSYKLNTEFIIYAGTYGKLTINGKFIYLHNEIEKILVPLIFWKFVYDKLRTTGIFIVISNDIDSILNQDFCNTTPCPAFKECNLENLQDRATGISFCCKYDVKLAQKLNLNTIKLPLNIGIINDQLR